jgi:integrase
VTLRPVEMDVSDHASVVGDLDPCAAARPGAAGGAQGRHAHAGRGAARRRAHYERSGYVVVDPLGRRYHPDTVSDYWAAACAKAGVKRIRLHDARHTCGTLMHLEHNVPVAIISAWLGHADTAFTMRTYVHNQPEKLALAAESISSWTRRKKSAQQGV